MNNYSPFSNDYFSMMNPNDRARIYQAMYPNLTYPQGGRSDAILGNYARVLMKQSYPDYYQQLQNYLNQINGR